MVEIRRCPGERIVWSGVPARYRFFRRQENTLGAYYALGTLYGLLVIPFLQDSVIDGRLNAHMLVSLLYPLLPVACLLSFVEWLIHRTVEYHVTDRRVIVAWRRWKRIQTKRSLRYLPPPSVKVRADGSGTVSFVPHTGAALHLEDVPDAVATHRVIAEAWRRSHRQE